MAMILGLGFEGTGLTAIDSSGNGYHGTLENGTSRVPGYYGGGIDTVKSLQQYVSLPQDFGQSLIGKSDVTVMAWINARNQGDDARVISWAYDGYRENHDLMLGFSSNFANLRARWRIDPNVNEVARSHGGNVSFGNWHHIAVAISGNGARFYVDGTSVGHGTNRGSGAFQAFRTGGAVSRNGIDAAAPWDHFDGLVDEVKIFDEELSASRIIEEKDTPVTEPGPAPGGPPIGSRSLLGAGI